MTFDVRNMVRSGAKPLAAVIGVFAGAYALQLIDGSRWTESLASVATVAATGAALYIATRDRHDRKVDQLNASRAQARLVQVHVMLLTAGGGYFGVKVENWSNQPILDVTFYSARYEDATHDVPLEPRREEYDTEVFRILGPPVAGSAPGAEFYVTHAPADASGQSLFAGGTQSPYGEWTFPRADASNVTAAVTFTDAGGQTWRRWSDGRVELAGGNKHKEGVRSSRRG